MKERDFSIDFMKGFLVVGMIFAHVLQFMGKASFPRMLISDYVNNITFSGFFFVFGYVFYVAYLQKGFEASWKRVLITFFKTLIAFYLSGMAYCLILGRGTSAGWVMRILMLNQIPGYSEFLVSFALATLAGLIFFIPLQKILERPIIVLVLCILLLFTTLIPYEKITSSQLGLLIGTKKFVAFPVLQYFPLWLIGAYMAKYKIGWNRNFFVVSFWCSLTYVICYFLKSPLIVRFSPSALWIISPLFFIYSYYLVSKLVVRFSWTKPFVQIGQNTLLYLLMSNFIIFLFVAHFCSNHNLSFLFCVLIACLIIFIIRYLISIITIQKKDV